MANFRHPSLTNNDLIMKKYIEIEAEALKRVKAGEKIQGTFFRDKETKVLVFRANRNSAQRTHDTILKEFPFGRVVLSTQRIKIRQSLPREMGAQRIMDILEENHETTMDTVEATELL